MPTYGSLCSNIRYTSVSNMLTGGGGGGGGGGLGGVVVRVLLQPLRLLVRISARALHVGKLVVTCRCTVQNLDQLEISSQYDPGC